MVSHKKNLVEYIAETIADAVYADDLAILANTPAGAEYQLFSVQQAASGISLYVNSIVWDKTGPSPVKVASLWNK